MNTSQAMEMSKVHDNKDMIVTKTSIPNESQEDLYEPQHELTNERQSWIERLWIWELSAWSICFLALIGMIGFLIPIDQKSVPKWVVSQTVRGYTLGFSVSINSIISIFSTVIKSTIMIPVAASIGQLKWLWFSDGHELFDFQRFEAARSGPLGAILLLWAMKGRQLVCLGALIMVASLGLDFSFQSLVTYPPVPVNVTAAYMPATSTYSSYSTKVSGNAQLEFRVPDNLMRQAISVGMQGLGFSVDPEPECATGNCTWSNSLVTLGVCSECFDATAKLSSQCGTINEGESAEKSCNYSLPNGLSLSNTMDKSGLSTLFTYSAEMSNTSFFSENKTLIAVLSTLGTARNYTSKVDTFSSQCALFACVKKFNISISEGKISSRVVEVHYAEHTEVNTTDGQIDMTVPASFMKSAGSDKDTTFTMTQNVVSAFYQYFYTEANFFGQFQTDATRHTFGATLFQEYIWSKSTEDLSVVMQDIAGNMTNAIRISSKTASREPGMNGIGTAYQDIPKVNVVWWWLFLPIILILLSLTFLIATMAKSKRKQAILWKTSALAPFYHPLAQDGREKLSQARGLRDLEIMAGKVKVKNELTERGYRLVQKDMKQS